MNSPAAMIRKLDPARGLKVAHEWFTVCLPTKKSFSDTDADNRKWEGSMEVFKR